MVFTYSDDEMHAALEVNIPNYATAILSADEVIDAISKSSSQPTAATAAGARKQPSK